VINLGCYIKWNFSDIDRPLDRLRITKLEVKIGCASGKDKDCFGGKSVGKRLYLKTRKGWDNDTEVYFREVSSEDTSWEEISQDCDKFRDLYLLSLLGFLLQC
jgi:hypothetical protein